jgi:uncharacterized protein YkwD
MNLRLIGLRVNVLGLTLITLVSGANVALACPEEVSEIPGGNPTTGVETGGSEIADISLAEASREAILLDAHNQYREEVNVPPLRWSNALAQSAQAWADHLASTDTFSHSDAEGYGENLWMGTTGFYSPGEMVDSWGSEKQYFISGATFPNVSTTGQWSDVGHYTQMVWRNTTEVGCGLATGNGWDILVCQYSPPGNFTNQKPF